MGNVKRELAYITVISFLSTIISWVLFYCFKKNIYLTLGITFTTITYHLVIREIVGIAFNKIKMDRIHSFSLLFNIHSWERKVYAKIKVKKWKDKMPTYSPSSFSLKEHSLSEIKDAMYMSELVHETNAILSFLPLLASIWLGSFFVFFITSFLASMFDLSFVVVQRYNRDRVMKIIKNRTEVLSKG